jgi:hypothetical protein
MKRTLFFVAAGLLACAGGPGDELGELGSGNVSCRTLPPEAYAKNADVARGIALDLADTSRALTIGIDSMSRVRVINTSTHLKILTNLTIHNSSATFSPDGAMSNATRTIAKGDVEAGLNSTSQPLSDIDTSRLRALTNEAIARCVRPN